MLYDSSEWPQLLLALVRIFVLSFFSAGVGRTGAFIVIDAMLERIKHEKTVDIYGHVTCLRAQRNYMVQTEDQYIFIHDALLEAVQSGNTEIPARNLYAHIQKLSQSDCGETETGMEVEFKVSTFICSRRATFTLHCRVIQYGPHKCDLCEMSLIDVF